MHLLINIASFQSPVSDRERGEDVTCSCTVLPRLVLLPRLDGAEFRCIYDRIVAAAIPAFQCAVEALQEINEDLSPGTGIKVARPGSFHGDICRARYRRSYRQPLQRKTAIMQHAWSDRTDRGCFWIISTGHRNLISKRDNRIPQKICQIRMKLCDRK